MEATKKKIKKGFAVPASKPSTEDSNEKNKPKKTLGINRNNNKKEEKKSPTEGKTEKPKSVEVKPRAQQSEKKKEKAKKKDGEEEKKVQRSLSAEEYDELFMNVLASVMKAEREGDVDEEEEGAPVKDGEEEEKGEVKEAEDEERVEESDEQAMSEVIQVTVKVESVDGSEHFAHVDPEHDIDNWDGAEKHPGAATARVISPIRKEIVKTFTPKQDKKTSLYKKQKQEKKTETLKVKEKQAAKSELKPKKKTIVVSNEDKDKKGEIVKKRKREEKSKPEAGRTEKAVKTRDRRDNISLKKVMQERELEDLGTWVQCGNADCLKWRYLRTITDPMDIPQRWECSMNDDEKFNSCEKEEEDYDEDEHIYTKYTEGSIVLAKMAGYPWWPGMIEIDPDYDSYFEVAVPASMYPTKYHVVFFDKNVSRAWISLSGIKPFNEIEALPRKAKGHDYSKEVNAAVKNAKEAMELPIKDRLKKFSFAIRFSGKWGKVGEPNVKAKKHKKRGPKRRKLEEEEVMVDDKTLDQILNNSQSVLSDVAEMLSSIETATFDTDSDPEFDSEAPKQRKRKTPAEKSEKECLTLNAMVFEEEEDEAKKEGEASVKFEPGQLDRDIFTMEMDTGPVETSDLEQTVNDLNLSKAIYEPGDAKNNITDSDDDDEAVTKGKGESRKNNEDEAKVETLKSKKKKTTNDYDKSVEKEDKVEKKVKNSKKKDEHQMNSEENNNMVEKKTKKKSKETDKNVDICSKEEDESPEKSNDKEVVKKKKKKSKKVDKHVLEQTDENVEQVSEKDETQKKKKKSKKNLDDEKVPEEKDKNVEREEGNEVVQQKKTKPKKNSDENEVSKKKKKLKKKDDTTDMKEVENNSESEGKKKEMVSKEKSNEDKEQNSKDSKETLEKTKADKNNTEKTKDDDSNTENTKEEKKTKPIKAKKPKSKFSNPVVKTTTKEDKGSQGEKNSQQEHQKEKVIAEYKTKKPESQVKSKTHPESDEELDFDIPTIPVDGAESDEDFLLDLMEPAQSKVQPAAQAAANDGDDSEPLDFEE